MTDKKYDSVIAATYLLAIAYDKNKVLNVTKVQKLLYMAYGYFLANGRVIFSESPKAWPYGPVFPRSQKKVDYSSVIPLSSPELVTISKDKEVTNLFNLLIDKYSIYSAGQLSEWSHSDDGPWDLTRNEQNFNWNMPIKDDLIADYFSELDI